MFNIEEELKKIPDKPGVYIMHDENDTIIYVGKAKLLKRRVRQYFQSSRAHSVKIQRMVGQIKWFEYIVTDSELEALVLESNLIKENRPKYNTMLTDDKSYPFIKVTVKEAFPRILFSRDAKHDNNKYFGPYTSAYAVKEIINFICGLYKIRTCNRVLPRDTGKDRECLNYHIGKCSAPCTGRITKELYAKDTEAALKFLKGNHDDAINVLQGKMQKAAQEQKYEDAANYRDLINDIKHIAQSQKITEDSLQNRDIIGYALNGEDAVIQIFFIREGRLLGRDNLHMNVAKDEASEEIISQFIKQYYSSTPFIPSELVVKTSPTDSEVIEEWLSSLKGQKVSIITPKKGTKEKLVTLADENAALILKKDAERLKREEARTKGALAEIASKLGLKNLKRVEAFDISNTNGIESVGSMVVFEEGKPKKHDYRRFKIQTVKGPDDYKSMSEVLERRFKRGIEEATSSGRGKGFANMPDIIFMDGGKGQVNIALDVLSRFNLTIPVAGMVKDDFHRTRGLFYNNKEIPIDTHSEGFKLITRIQDEAHRFAIEYHRKLRGKKQVNSVLNEISGIGEIRRKALMMYFKDIEKIRNASVSELEKVEGMNKKSAESVYSFFH